MLELFYDVYHWPGRPWFVASPLRIVLACMLTRLYLMLAVLKYANAAFLCQAYVLRVFAVAVICFPMLLCCCLHQCCCAVHGLLIARLCCWYHMLLLLTIFARVEGLPPCPTGPMVTLPERHRSSCPDGGLPPCPSGPMGFAYVLLLCCCCLLSLLFCTAYVLHVFRCYGFCVANVNVLVATLRGSGILLWVYHIGSTDSGVPFGRPCPSEPTWLVCLERYVNYMRQNLLCYVLC